MNGEPVSSSLLGPLNEGDPLTLHCTATSGVPKGQLAWFRESLQLISTAEPTNFDLTTLTNRNTTNNSNEELLSASLRIERLTREHLMAVYSCKATNNNLTEPSVTTSEVTVDLNCKSIFHSSFFSSVASLSIENNSLTNDVACTNVSLVCILCVFGLEARSS